MSIAQRNLAKLGLMIVSAMTGPAMAQTTEIVPAQPLNPRDWVSPNDYPANAMRNGESGKVEYLLSYDIQGKVTGCEVTASSGSADLDRATCQSLMSRARLKPGTKGGKPEAGVYRGSMYWRMPEDAGKPMGEFDPIRPQFVTITFVVHADGKVTDCRASLGEGARTSVPLTSGGPLPCVQGFVTNPPKDANGNPVNRRVTQMFVTKVEDIP